jgi:5-methylcytosine-specific restriction endonuclease McrA
MHMARKKERTEAEKEQLLDEARRERERRLKGYRERALRMFPPVCAHCGREFSGKRLRELTVHHKDHDHDNNPPDGSNWELLCIYCHDHEHSKYLEEELYGQERSGGDKEPSATYRPFEGLDAMLKDKKAKK